jgi:hypothetical protein
MNVRHTIAAFTLALAAPFAAYADQPAGDINTVFAVDQSLPQTGTKFDGHGYNPNVDQLLAGLNWTPSTVTREEVRELLAKMPPAPVGA